MYKFRGQVLHPDEYNRFKPGDWVEGSLWVSHDGCWISALEDAGFFDDPWVHVDCNTVYPVSSIDAFIEDIATITSRDYYALMGSYLWAFDHMPPQKKDAFWEKRVKSFCDAAAFLMGYVDSLKIHNTHVKNLLEALAQYLTLKCDKIKKERAS